MKAVAYSLLTLGAVVFLASIYGLVMSTLAFVDAYPRIIDFASNMKVQALQVELEKISALSGWSTLAWLLGLGLMFPGHILARRAGAMAADPEAVSEKGFTKAALCCFFLGSIGAHRFLAGKPVSGTIYIFTLGGCIIGMYIDFILLCFGQFRDAGGKRILYPL